MLSYGNSCRADDGPDHIDANAWQIQRPLLLFALAAHVHTIYGKSPVSFEDGASSSATAVNALCLFRESAPRGMRIGGACLCGTRFQGFASRNSDPLPFNQYVTHKRAVQGVGVGCPNARVDASNGNRDGRCLDGFTGLLHLHDVSSCMNGRETPLWGAFPTGLKGN